MKLSISNRINVISLLPQQSGYTDKIIKQDVLKKIELTQELIKEAKIKSIPSQDGKGSIMTWDQTKDPMIEVEFTDLEHKYIRDELEKLDKAKKLEDYQIDLYRWFVLKEPQEEMPAVEPEII